MKEGILGVKKIAIIYTWPGSKVSGEAEFIFRFVVAAKNLGIGVDIISNQGFVLDANLCETDKKAKAHEYIFQILLHFLDVVGLDVFSYLALWNPPLLMLEDQGYNDATMNNIIFPHDYISLGSKAIEDYANAIFAVYRQQSISKSYSILMPSIPKVAVRTPSLVKNPNIFYCGLNWERFIPNKAIRHLNLFKMLDTLPYMRFYGVKEAWIKHKRYIGSIPFDGFSILDEINKCGVCLVLSSKNHWQAEVATNRLYEGVAAGAVVISDYNKFVAKHFEDSVLYIDFNTKNPKRMFEQIKNHFEWIKANPEKAINMVEKAQKILIEKFSLEDQLENIISNHPKRLANVKEELYSKEPEKEALIVAFVDATEFAKELESWLKNILQDINRQEDKSVIFALACEEKLVTKVRALLINDLRTRIFSFKIFDDFGNRTLTRCEMLFDIVSKVKHDYLMIFTGNETIFSEHITTLKRTLENNKDMIAAHSYMSRRCGARGGVYLELRRHILNCDIYHHQLYMCNGIFLMRAEIESYVPKTIPKLIDGCEMLMFLVFACLMYNQKITSSNRITTIRNDKGEGSSKFIDTKNCMEDGKQLKFIRLLTLKYSCICSRIPSVEQHEYSIKLIGKHLKKLIWIERVKVFFTFSRKKMEKRRRKLETYRYQYHKLRCE